MVGGLEQTLRVLPTLPSEPGLEEIEHVLYQIEAVPINIAGERTAVLKLAKRFELSRLPLAGQALLLRNGKVDLSMLPARWNKDIERQISERCTTPISACDVTLEVRILSFHNSERNGSGGVTNCSASARSR